MYQPRYYTAPPDPTVAIVPGATSDTQLRIIPGSVIAGLRFTTLNGFPPNQVMYLLRDSNTQKAFVDGESRFLNCQMLVPTGASGAAYCLFAKPYMVSAGDNQSGGVITVSLANMSTTTPLNCQLMLVVLEPAQIVTTADDGSIMVPRKAA